MKDRKLASIQKIREIKEIEGKDRIVQSLALGWSMVTQKSNGFQPGDFCVLFEIDSILPDEEWCAFLGENKRIKTKKFGGVLAQGLILPLDTVPIGDLLQTIPEEDWDGLDLTVYLGVKQWEPPLDTNSGDSKGAFPSYIISKTDEIRIQSEPSLLYDLIDTPWYASLKCDGSSATYLWGDTNEFWACSRNMRKSETSHFYEVGLKYGLDKELADQRHLVFQGEIVGPGIQGNKMGRPDKEFYVFNIYDRDGRFYYGIDDMKEICDELNLPLVPILYRSIGRYSISEFVEMAKGNYPDTKTPREGIVVRPDVPMYSPILGGPLSFKVINPDYLLKYES